MNIVERAQQRYATLYSTGLPYHNLKHIEKVVKNGMYLIDRLTAFRIPVDRDAFLLAALLHDNDFAKDPAMVIIQDGAVYRKARSREEVAAWNGVQLLQSLGYSDASCKVVEQAILATNVMATPKSYLEQVMRAADLFPVGNGTPKQFASTTRLLHKEAELLKGESIPYDHYVRGSVSYLGLYLCDRVQLTPCYYTQIAGTTSRQPRRSAWHEGAMRNILATAHEVWPDTCNVVVEVDGDERPFLTQTDTPLADTHTVYVVIGKSERLKASLLSVGSHYKTLQSPAPMTLGLPKERGLSLPKESVDTLVFLTPTVVKSVVHLAPTEIRRVLKRSGRVRIIQPETSLKLDPLFRSEKTFAATCEWLVAAGMALAYEDKTTPVGPEWVFQFA